MNKEEMERLQYGQKLLGKIKKLEVQIESLKEVSFINFGTDKKTSRSNAYTDYKSGFDEIERVVNYNIAINPNDKVPHPFAKPAQEFIKMLMHLLDQQRQRLQEEFDSL